MTVSERCFCTFIAFWVYFGGWKRGGVNGIPGILPMSLSRATYTLYVFPLPCRDEHINVLGCLETMVHWVEGPFVNDVEYESPRPNDCGSSLRVQLFDSVTNPEERMILPSSIMSHPLNLRPFLDGRHRLSVEFSLNIHSNEPVELRWVHFRGNTQLVPLGHESEALLIHPGQSTRQFTQGGHMFVAMSTAPANPTQFRDVDQHRDFVMLECSLQRVVGLYMMPAVSQDCSGEIDCALIINIGAGESALYHTQKLEKGSQCASHPEGIVFSHSPTASTTACFKELLMKYWEHQRLSQVYVNTWAVPTIPLAGTQSEGGATDGTRQLFHSTSLSDFHYGHRTTRISVPEPPISLVFNQFEVPTWHVPLPAHLLDQLVEEVHRAAAEWLGLVPEDLLLTGAYGSREYRHGAVVRWHVDPAHSQPVTAIVHLAENYSAANGAKAVCSDARKSGNELNHHSDGEVKCPVHSAEWSVQVPKSVQTYRSYSNYTDAESSSELHSVHLRVGQVLLLQSAKLPHARASPFVGEWYANAFVHFAPVGWAEREDVQSLS